LSWTSNEYQHSSKLWPLAAITTFEYYRIVIKNNLKILRGKISICYEESHVLLFVFFLFFPLTIAFLSFIYTLLGNSQEPFTLWQNIYVSLFSGYKFSFIFFLLAIPIQLFSYASNRKIIVNGVNAAEPENTLAIMMLFKLFIYCILYFILSILFFPQFLFRK
jgi:hypothetical protein